MLSVASGMKIGNWRFTSAATVNIIFSLTFTNISQINKSHHVPTLSGGWGEFSHVIIFSGGLVPVCRYQYHSDWFSLSL